MTDLGIFVFIHPLEITTCCAFAIIKAALSHLALSAKIYAGILP